MTQQLTTLTHSSQDLVIWDMLSSTYEILSAPR